MASNPVPITVAHGDGIGPEIMAASLHIMKAAGARIREETIEIGEKVYLRGVNSGIEPSARESVLHTQVFFKAPITTPQGGGFKSLNVTTRKTLGLYANVRPCVSYYPYVQTKHPGMDVEIEREKNNCTKDGASKQKVGTKEFAEAVAARIGQKPQNLKAVSYSKAPKQNAAHRMKTGGGAKKVLVGVDASFDWKQRNPEEFGKKLEQLNGDGLKLFAVSNRGTKVYPEGFTETFCTDHWRARFMGNGAVSHAQIVALLDRAGKANLDFIKIENLYTFDGQKGFVAEGE